MKTDEIVDYAMPLMNIEKLAKQVHDRCLEGKFGEAREVALHLGAETRILLGVLTIMEEDRR